MYKYKASFFFATSLMLLGLFDGLCTTKIAVSQDFFDFPPPEEEVESPAEQRLNKILEKQRQLEAEYNLLQQQIELTRLKGTVIAPTTSATEPLDSSDTSVQQGSFQTVESRILAYEAMNKVAGSISKDISAIDGINSLIIYDQEIFSDLTAYRLLKVKLREFKQRYADLGIVFRSSRPRTRGSRGITDLSSLALPTTFTRSVLEFVALFRSKDQITFEPDFELNPNAFISAVASHIQKKDIPVKVYNPSFYLTSLDSLDESSLEGLVGSELADLMQLRSKAASEYVEPTLLDLNDEVDAFLDALLVPVGQEDPFGNPPLLAIIQANKLEKILDDQGAHVLHLDIDVAGGSHRTRQSLFTTMFSGKRISFSGGSVVNYSLFARDGSLKKSGFFYYNTGYKSMNGKRTNID
ncbi:MAG: hypothetical protein AAF329_17105 [Cyanobacteria bacterium P01_A01_bin.17]